MRICFVKVLAELGEGVVILRKTEGDHDGLMNVCGSPTADLSPSLEQPLNQTNHPGIVNLPGR